MMQDTVNFGEADLSTCDREPIHIPGSIQPHGILLVVERDTLCVEQTAGDTLSLLGLEPTQVLGRPLADLLETKAASFVAEQLATSATHVAPVMRLAVHSSHGQRVLDLTLHALDGTAIVELEPVRSVLASGNAATNDPIACLKGLFSSVQNAESVEACCAGAAIALRAATGFDRAMVYRFLPDESGEVVAEDARAGLESFLGLHYPASDIPKQARELYRRNWLRAIADIDYVPAPLQPALNPRTGQTIDMSHCGLRSVSPIHLEYLRNMGVCASLSASIVCRDKLWGMLVLHHNAPRLVSAELRVACETFAQIFSFHVDAKAQTETTSQRLNAQRTREILVGRLASTSDIATEIAQWDMLSYVNATGAVVHLDGRSHLVGTTPTEQEVSALCSWLTTLNQPLYATDRLASVFPPAAAFSGIASGLLTVGLSREPRDYVLWFRPELGRAVRWAGDPTKPKKVDRHGERLTPRGSFKEWLEVTRMQAAPWSTVDLEAAEGLRVVLLESVLNRIDLVRREREFEAARAMADELELRVARRTDQIRMLASDLEAAEDRERRQIARDLHDDLGQTLAAARIRLAALCDDARGDVRGKANEVGSLIDEASRSIRSLATQLAPAVLNELGLMAALDWLGEEIERTFGLKVTVIDDGEPKPLDQVARSIVYRAVRELLINVAKHAKTKSARVETERNGGVMVVRVSDQGIGYDTGAAVPGPDRSLGLINVRERLSLIGGTLDIHSRPGAGTLAVLTVLLGGDEGTQQEFNP